jgi:NAD(P)-dependent dehydrogenase (short-subunit alcohol dehydrogenase family)
MVDSEQRGRIAVVTGGGSGIGRGIALALAADGVEVCVTGRRAAALDETAALVAAAGGTCRTQLMDVTDRRSVEDGFARMCGDGRGLDILVNNAGVGGPNGCVVDGPDRFDTIVRTNVDGVFFCTRAAAPYLVDGGRVVNVSSVLGRFGVPGYTAYCASKHAVIGFTRALALELAPRKITANAICPGWVETEMAKEGMELIARGTGTDYAQARAGALAMVPLGRILEPAEIGGLVVYLCSAIASGMTGQAISLCGGATMI